MINIYLLVQYRRVRMSDFDKAHSRPPFVNSGLEEKNKTKNKKKNNNKKTTTTTKQTNKQQQQKYSGLRRIWKRFVGPRYHETSIPIIRPALDF